jgi:hypothetical protein
LGRSDEFAKLYERLAMIYIAAVSYDKEVPEGAIRGKLSDTFIQRRSGV